MWSLKRFLRKVIRLGLFQASSNRYKIGILAYGSLINCLGEEMQDNIVKTKNAKTPFKVEFARSSKTRNGAPTLIPCREGAKVKAKILVLKEDISEKGATDMLYRRERNKVGRGIEYKPLPDLGPNHVVIEVLENFRGIKFVLYAKIKGNIDNPTPKNLACLAIKSARFKAGKQRRDGISYLYNAKCSGIKTPLMPNYEKEVLRKTNAKTLREAWLALTT